MVDVVASPDYEQSRSVLNSALKLASLGSVNEALHWLQVADDLGAKCGMPLGDAVIGRVKRIAYEEGMKRMLESARYFASRGDVPMVRIATEEARKDASQLGPDISERVRVYTLHMEAEAAAHNQRGNSP